jgi:hypothetical protein
MQFNRRNILLKNHAQDHIILLGTNSYFLQLQTETYSFHQLVKI